MNVPLTKVYRELKMRILFLLLLLPVQSLFAQTNYMPFELERMPSAYYQSIIGEQDTAFKSEIEALTYYFLAFKLQRSESPASYFPAPNRKRNYASAYLKTNYSKGAGMALVHFLENWGDKSSCDEILLSNSDYELMLPYKFVAAELTQNEKEARQVLEKMNAEGMISQVLKDFGRNAVTSLGDKKTVLTQGIQDLIAISIALDGNSKSDIQNLFLEQCHAFAGRRVNSIVQADAENIWVAPTVNFSQLETSGKLHLQGIGFVFTADADNLAKTISIVGLNFSGLDDAAQSPADRGLIRSYRYFSATFSDYSAQFGSKKEKQASESIHQIVKQADK